MESVPTREVRAVFTHATVRVYQAYNDEIADAALKAQRFVPPWNPTRTTWIKPSAVWMGYRCVWARKDRNQTRVLAVDLHREGFDRLLRNAVLATAQKSCGADVRRGEVIVQWDPERGLGGGRGAEQKNAMTHPMVGVRSLQMGLRAQASRLYTREIAAITDVTDMFRAVGELLQKRDLEGAEALLPKEEVYHVDPTLAILAVD